MGASEIGTDGVADEAEAGRTYVHIRVTQIGVVENVGECSLGPQPDSFSDGENFAQAGREIDRARTNDGTDARVAEPSRLGLKPGRFHFQSCRRCRAAIRDSQGR